MFFCCGEPHSKRYLPRVYEVSSRYIVVLLMLGLDARCEIAELVDVGVDVEKWQ